MDESAMKPGPDRFAGLTEADWERLHAYADGELTSAERAAFESEVASRAELGAAVDAIASTERFLRETYGLAEGARGETNVDQASIIRRIGPRRTWLVTRVAAAAVLVVSALAIRSYLFSVSSIPQTAIATDVAQLYDWYKATMEPTVVCDTAPKFVRYTQEAFGQRIHADFDAASEAGVAFVGWVYPDDLYGGGPGGPDEVRGRIVLLAFGPGETPVITVFQDPSWPVPESADGLRVKSARFGDVAAYEIGPSIDPLVLPLLDG